MSLIDLIGSSREDAAIRYLYSFVDNDSNFHKEIAAANTSEKKNRAVDYLFKKWQEECKWASPLVGKKYPLFSLSREDFLHAIKEVYVEMDNIKN
jgi:hypothetical protein